MDLLENKIVQAFEQHFQAKAQHVSITRDGDTWGAQYGLGLPSAWTILVTLINSKHTLATGERRTLGAWQQAQFDLFDQILDNEGRLTHITNKVDSGRFQVELIFRTHNIEAFEQKLNNLAWKMYSEHFESFLEEELTKS